MATRRPILPPLVLQVASDPKIEGYGNISSLYSMSDKIVASDPKIEGYGNYSHSELLYIHTMLQVTRK